MNDIYSVIRKEICALVAASHPSAPSLEPDADCARGQLSLPLGHLLGEDGAGCAGELSRLESSCPREFMGRRLIERIEGGGGHVCFYITAGALSAAMTAVEERYPMPPMPEHTGDEVSYAVCRMIMLSRQGGEGCPDEERIREALWLCLGIEGFRGKKREAVRKRAAAAVLNIMQGRSFPERERLRRELGQFGRCGARLLSLPANI